MLSVHLESGSITVRQEPLPRVPKGFARIRVLAAGICSTDLELQRGYYGFSGTPGHEFVGEVVAVSESTKSKDDHSKLLGHRVAGEINLACGKCRWCRAGVGRHCPTRTVLGIVGHPGAFREFITLPITNLHRIPDSIPTEHAVFIEPLAAACEILDQVKLPKDEKVAVLGDGKLGLLVSQVLETSGARVHLFGRHKEKMRLLAKTGVTVDLLPERIPQREYRWVVDATGSSQGLEAAVAMCQPRGTVVMKSTVHGLVALDTAPVIVNEITLLGSRCGRFEPALRLLQRHKVEVSNLISDEFPLDRAPEAFERAAKKGVLKVLLRPPA